MAAVCVSLSAASRADAQVNVEGLRKELSGDGVLGKINGSLTSYTGNTTGLELGLAGLLGWRSAAHLAYSSLAVNYSHLGGEVQVANAFVHVRYAHAFRDWIASEIFAQAENDRFRSLRLRALFGLGPRFTVLDQEVVGLFYGISYMYEHDELDGASPRVRPSNVHRLSNYASLVVVLEPKRAVLSNTVYVQPRFDAPGDLRLLGVFSFDVIVTGQLSAGVHATLRHENPVQNGIKPTDFMVKNTLGVVF